jgi:ubiquinone/menaquinone biosynthesis C-methylase UbiE
MSRDASAIRTADRKENGLTRRWSFDERASTYDNLRWVRDEALLGTMIRLLSEHGLADRRVILDLATGTGAVADALADERHLVLGLDLSCAMLNQAAVRSSSRIRFVRAAGERAPLRDGSVDLVVCRNGLHQMRDPKRALSELRRILCQSGVVCVIESVAPSAAVKDEWREIIVLKDQGRHPDFAFTAEELQDWLKESGYEILGATAHEVSFDVDEWITMGVSLAIVPLRSAPCSKGLTSTQSVRWLFDWSGAGYMRRSYPT